MSNARLTATCHCGAVILDFEPQGDDNGLGRCDCSFCRRSKPAALTALTSDLRVVEGTDMLRLYQFGTKTAKHWFCTNCGIHTHHQRRSDPTEMGVNIGCVDGMPPRLAGDAPWFDGVQHPSDRA